MRFRQQIARRATLFLFCAFILFQAVPSDAHMYFSFPDNSKPSGQVDVYTTFSLRPPVPDEAGYGTSVYDIAGRVVTPSGTTGVTDFPFSDSATGKTYTGEELAAMGEEAAEKAVDSRKSRISVTGGGTSVFLTEADYVNDEVFEGTTYHQDFICGSKVFLNLTADGASTKTYLSSGLELIPLDDLASVAPATQLRVRALLNGAPLAGLDIYVGYEGCPMNPDLHGEVAAMRAVKTGADGTAVLITPSRPGNTYLFAMYLDEKTTATNFSGNMASLSFEMTGAEAEVDISSLLFAAGNNRADLGAPIMLYAPVVDYIRTSLGMVWANDLISAPRGASAYVTGMEGQLSGEGTGATFSIPMDISGASVKGAIGTEQTVALTADMLGQAKFDRMVSFLKEARQSDPGRFLEDEAGNVFYCPYTAKDFLGRFDIYVMGKFSHGATIDIGDSFMLGALYKESDFNDGKLFITYGTLYADSATIGGSHAADLTAALDPDGITKVPLLYDGVQDGKLEMTYWLAGQKSAGGGSGGSSGCSAGIPAAAIALLAALGIAGNKKRK